MAGFISVQVVGGRSLRASKALQRALQEPPRHVKEAMAETMRVGPGGVREQFDREMEMHETGSRQWKKTEPFGNRQPGPSTLVRTGKLRAAWTGDVAGSVTLLSPGVVGIGVDTAIVPQAGVFQRQGWTPIPITPKSRVFLGKQFGVWTKKSRFLLEGRPVSTNPRMTDAVGRLWTGWIASGEVRRRAAA